LLGIKYKTTKP